MNDCSEFVHLHVHTNHSELDSTITCSGLFKRCNELGMKAVAITDHGTLAGLPTFYLEAQKNGIKPILGCEFYMAPTSRFEKTARGSGEAAYHLVLIAMNEMGLVNLAKLDMIARLEGYYYFPRIDREVLARFNEGLICLTGCLHGYIPHLVSIGKIVEAQKEALWLKHIFGDHLYLEIQMNGLDIQENANFALAEFSSYFDIPLVATNDCHYLTEDDLRNFEELASYRAGKVFDFSGASLHLKSSAEMKKAFRHYPEALSRTIEIANRCKEEINIKYLLGAYSRINHLRGSRPPVEIPSKKSTELDDATVNMLNELFKDELKQAAEGLNA